MVQKTIKVASGQSKAGAGASTLAASMLGDKSATKAVNKAIWGTATRNYTRNKQVWECRNGCTNNTQTTYSKTVSQPVPRGKPRSSLLVMSAADVKDCRAEHFYDLVGELDFSQRTSAEQALVTAYLGYYINKNAEWYERFGQWCWKAVKYIYGFASILLWILFVLSMTGVI